MAQQSDLEARKMLDVYILDYFRKRNLHASANAFVNEAMVAEDPVEFHAPAGFLSEWWSVFLDIFFVMKNHPGSEGAAAYIKAQQMKAQALDQQKQKMQQWQQYAQLQQMDANHPSLRDPTNAIISGVMLGQPTSSDLEAKAYESYMNPHQLMETAPSLHLLAANRIVQSISAANYPGQIVQGNPDNEFEAFQQIQSWTQQNTAEQMIAEELEQLGQKMQQWQQHTLLQKWQQHALLQQWDANHPSLSDPTNAITSEVMLGQPT